VVRSALSGQRASFDQGAHALLEEERVTLCALDQERLEGPQRILGAQQPIE
jgi:hypothetical protein